MNRSLPHFLVALGSKCKTFKNLSALAVVLLLCSGGMNAQVTTNSSSGLAPTYTTLAAAITALNGVTITAPVTITLTASNPQTAPAGGYSITATGTITNTITITGNSNTITAPAQTSGNLNDAIFKIIGGDYITIQGFTMQERSFTPVAADTATGTNTMTEWGVALLETSGSTVNGAQNNTIQNNTITLSRLYQNSFGIYSNPNHTLTAPTLTVAATNAAGSNSFNKFYTNTISNVNFGIVVIGSNAATASGAQDNGNDIGGNSSLTGNIITNSGGIGVAASTYALLTGSNYLIFVNNQYNDNISFNTITSAVGAAQTVTIVLGGILKNYSTGATAQPTGTIVTTINNNTVTLTNSPAAAATGSVIGINNQGLSFLSTATVNMNNNTVQNCVNGGANITTGGFTGITNLSSPGTLNMNGNSVINNAITGATATSGSLTAISNTGAAGTVNINNNIVRSLASTGTSSQIAGIINTGAIVTTLNINNNSLGNSTSGFFSTSTATSGALFGISSSGGSATCTTTIQSNDIRGITYNTAATGANTYITSTGTPLSNTVSSNTFTNLSVNTTGSVTFINHSYTIPATGSMIINNNSIVTAFTRLAAGSITITTTNGSSVSGAINNYTNNNFSNIIVPDNASSTIIGFNNTDGGTASTKTITGNIFNNWHGGTSGTTGTSSTINCMNFTYWNGVSSLSNNTITNITGRGAITGITMGATVNTATSIAVSGNTINNLASIGTGGQVLAISCSNTSTTININGNAINSLSSTAASSAVGAITVLGATTTNVFQNVIYDLSTSGATAPVALGIQVAGGTLVNVYRNKIYNLSASGGTLTSSNSAVSGIYLNGGTTVNTYNNLIGNLTAPNINLADAIRGISITSTTSSASYKIYNNTVYLSGSGGTNFGSSGIYHAASANSTTANLDLQNNMIFNTCTPSGAGIVTAYRRSSGVASMLANYASASNKNLFYAGTPGASNLIYSDGTSSAQTMAAYQAGVFTAGTVAARDANSFTESSFTPSTYFVSTTGSNANYLQPASGITTQAEGGGNTITMCSPDYNGVTRPGFSGAAYDVGAWEFAGVSPAPVLTSMSPSPALTAQCTKAARAISITITTASGTITGATLNYNHNGTAQTAVTMTNSSGNTWTGTMLAPATGNATVTWSITATNSLGLNTLYNGTSYADEPNTGITATATASPSSVCDGSNASLSVSLASVGTTTIGTGTFQPSATAGYSAFNGYFSSQWSQTIFTGAELSASGLVAGPISSIAYNISTQGSSTSNNITIKVGTTTSSTVGTTFVPTSSFTTVYGPTSYTHTSSGWQTINFANNFIWDGVSNIILDVWQDGPNSSANPLTYCTGLADNKVLYYYNTSTVGATGTPTIYRMNTKFGGLIAPTPTAYSWSNGSSTLGTTNPLTTAITSGLTYTATATVNGCPMTASVTPTVNPLPTAPTATNSAQCGAGVPSASVADNNSYTTPTFKWYSVASGGTALQSSTSTTYTTSISATTTFYVAVVGTNTCESARTAVTVTVTQPDAISASASVAAICLGQSVTLTAANIATTPTQSYSYSWICSTTGSGATTANTNNPTSVTPTAAGNYVYTVTGTDGSCSAVNTVSVTVNALPTITSATASPNPVCSGGTINLSANSLGASLSSILGNSSGTAISTTGTPYRTGTTVGNQIWNQYLILASELTAAGFTTANINSLGINVSTISPTGTMTSFSIGMANVSDAALTSTLLTNALTSVFSAASYSPISGINTHTLSSPFLWDGSSNLLIDIKGVLGTGGLGTSLVTSTTPGGIIATVQANSATGFSSTTGTTVSNQRPQFTLGYQSNATSSYTWSWNSTPAIATASGSTTETNTGASATSKTYTVTATNATTGCTNTATTSAVTINPAPVAPTATNSTQCGSGTPTCSVSGTGTLGNTFKWYTVSTGGTALVGQSASTLSSYPIATTTTFYVSESNGTCESARTAVTVTVSTPPAITATATLNTVCSGSPTVLSASSANSGYTYSWSNSLGSGASVTASPTANTTYTVTGTDSSGGANNGCATTATVAITTNAVPSAITFSPASATICNGSSQSIVASGGIINPTYFSEDFNSGLSSWPVTNSGASPSVSNWIAQTAPLTDASGSATFLNFSTTNGGKFAYANPDAGGNGTITNTVLESPSFNTLGAASATLTFEHVYQKYFADQTVTLEISIDNGATWSVLKDYKTLGSQGTTTSNAQATTNESITLANTYLNQASVKIRFNYVSAWGFFWLIDNIKVSEIQSTTMSWSPTTTLFTDAAATIAYTGNPTTVYAKPTATTTYTATATSAAGCTSSNTVTVNVNPTNTAGTASSTPTLCINTALTSITHATTGATGIGAATNLPSGVTASWASNSITISGTPTASGTFNYSIPLTGGCGSVNATGTIVVTATNTAGTASSTPTLCINTALTSITHATTGANGIGAATNLPSGVTASWASNTITISGTPTVGGTFNYSIPLTGGCGSVNATGTITVISDKTWIGGTSTSWSTPSNWSCGTLPTATDVIVISSGSPVLDTNFTVGASGSLTISGTSTTFTIGASSTLTIEGATNFGGKAVTIQSNATGNGAIGQVTGTNLTGATNVTVERYIPAKRSWRAITAPLKGSDSSVFSQWQNNGNSSDTTIGVELWGPNGTGMSGNGLAVGPSNSILQYNNTSTGAWTAVTNTKTTNLFTTSGNNAFMVFPTGGYGSGNILSSSTASASTLKATGQLITGQVTYTNLPNTSHTLIGNPYASPIDPATVITSNASLGGNIWVWDANTLGSNNVGCYNLFNSGAYTNLTGSLAAGVQIQSGQAFFVKPPTNSASFTIEETHKSSAWNNAVFRTAAPELLRVGLYKQVNNEWAGRDGAMTVILADANANQLPNKMANGTENIVFTKNGGNFASNHHLPLVATDVLNVKVWNTSAGANYKLKINTEQFATTNLNATLEDLFTNARTPLALDGTAVEYPFTVTTDALSTGDRFRIVFQTAALSTNNPKANGFSIVPNPVTGDAFQVNLGTLATGTYTYSICNAIGQEVEKGSINNAAQNTNYTVKFRESAATGMYIMKIKGSDNSVFTAKIIKK